MHSATLLIALAITALLMFSAGYLLQLSTAKIWVKRCLLLFVVLYGAQMALLVATIAGIAPLQQLRLMLAVLLPASGYYCFALSLREPARPRFSDSFYLAPLAALIAGQLCITNYSTVWIDALLIVNELIFGLLLVRLAKRMQSDAYARWRQLALAFAILFIVLAGFDMVIFAEVSRSNALSNSLSLLLALWFVTVFWLLALLFIGNNKLLLSFIDAQTAKTTELVAKVLPTGLSNAELHHIASLVLQHFRQQRSYLDEHCNLSTIANSLQLPARQVSAAINRELGKGFSTLLNDFRVEHAASLLRDPACAHLPIISLMYEAGFRTKSSFNREFSLRLGMSPSQYRQSEQN